MHLNEFYFQNPDIFSFKALHANQVDPEDWNNVNEVCLVFKGDGYYLNHSKVICPVMPLADDGQIRSMVSHGNTLWGFRRLKSGVFYLQATEAAIRIGLNMQIGVDEDVTERLVEKKEISSADLSKTLRWLTEEFVLQGTSGTQRVFAAHYEKEGAADFQILGRRWCAGISRPKNAPQLLVKLMRLTSQQMVPCLLEGGIEFIDVNSANCLLDPVSQRSLERALRESYGGYLELWKEYGRIEWQSALTAARELGDLHYREYNQVGDEFIDWRFIPTSNEEFESFKERWRSQEVAEELDLEVAQDAPPWLHAKVINVDPLEIKSRQNSIHGKIRFDGNAIILRVDEKFSQKLPPAKGVLYASLAGHITVQQRRERAKQSIDRGERLPQLRYILEGVALPAVVSAFTRRKYKDITLYARETFKKGSPTEMQKKAIYAAMNTPDIAIIVGPPGTGKTQVIAAIQRRLAEEFGDQPLQHQVLISSFQHDAVENALARTEVFGLPPYKVGLRSRGLVELDPVQAWCKRKNAQVTERLHEMEADEPYVPILKALSQEITILRVAHLSINERSNRLLVVAKLVDDLAQLGLRLPMSLRDRWSCYLERVTGTQKSTKPVRSDSTMLRFVRSIRVTQQSFTDDGPERTWRCLREIERSGVYLQPEHYSVLKKAADAEGLMDSNSLSDLCSVKDNLLDTFIPDYRPSSVKSLIEPELAGLLNDIVISLEEPIRNSRRGVAASLADYCDALIHEPEKVRQAAREYCSIVGATCQQSASEKMASLKQLSKVEGGTAQIEFDTVIIDEAARANPLDLFIPMSMARRRIILVGDHLQLPHLLDPEIEDELGKKFNLQEAQKEAMKQSLFERLVTQLRKMEDVDKHPRVVMLDTQYRMHSVLGDFVSRNFYEKVGERAVKSVRPAEDFKHNLPGYEGKVCAWLNVSSDEGREEKFSSSKRRRCEAKHIAKELNRLMTVSPELSFGVITFYSAQRDYLMREMASQDITEEFNNTYKIRPEWANAEDGTERLCIGTVDAFQGKEFDVVFLSLVRSTKSPGTHQKTEEHWNSRYGFLRLPNRMNVAMSRQRRLLILAGDIDMANDGDAKDAVPALHEFLKLCRGPHGVIC